MHGGRKQRTYRKDGKTYKPDSWKLFNEDYNKYAGKRQFYPDTLKDKYYKVFLGWGGFYGEMYEDAPDQREYIKKDKYGEEGKDEKNEETYLGQIQKILKKRKFDIEYQDMFEDAIYLHAGDRIYFNMKGHACGHCGVYAYVYVGDAAGNIEDKPIGELVMKNTDDNEDNDTSRCFFDAEKSGEYMFYVSSALFSCKYAEIYVSTQTDAEIFTDKYSIAYSAEDDEGHSIDFVNNPSNKTSYTRHDTPMTILDPSKPGWVFDGWTQPLGKSIENPYFAAKKDGTADELTTVTKSPQIKQGSYGYRHYVAHFHMPLYVVKHEYEQLDGRYVEDVWQREIKKALIGTVVTPSVKNVTGFTSPPTQTVTVMPDSTTEVTYRYKRNSYPCKVIDMDLATRQTLGGPHYPGDSCAAGSPHSLGDRLFGSQVSGSEIGSSDALGAYYAGYTFDHASALTVGVGENTVYRYFSSTSKKAYQIRHWLLDKGGNRPEEPFHTDSDELDKQGECKVYHEQEQPDGSYEIVEVETVKGNPGEEVTQPVKEHDGFVSPET